MTAFERYGEVEVEGGMVRYVEVGEANAPTLVLAHGGPGFGSSSSAPLKALADNRRLIVYDQLGCGRSDHPRDPSLWRIERFVDELETLRAHLELERFSLLGHSWGGMLAIDYVLAHPERLTGLVLSSTLADVELFRREAERLLQGFPAQVRATLQEHAARGAFDHPDYKRAIRRVYDRHVCRRQPWPRLLAESFTTASYDVYETMWGNWEFAPSGNLADYDRVARLGSIATPTLVVVGEHDEVTPACARQIHAALPDSELVVFPGCSHLAFLEDPSAYLRVTHRFLRRIEGWPAEEGLDL